MGESDINAVNAILDIHTHKGEEQSGGKAIINYRQLAGTPLQEGYYYSVGIHPWELTPDNLKQQSDFIIEHLPDKRIVDRKSTRLNSSHTDSSRMPSSA